jgi:hypothetical protein
MFLKRKETLLSRERERYDVRRHVENFRGVVISCENFVFLIAIRCPQSRRIADEVFTLICNS